MNFKEKLDHISATFQPQKSVGEIKSSYFPTETISLYFNAENYGTS